MAALKIERLYNKENIFKTLDSLEISRQGTNILTKYDGRLISNVTVSKIYEIFDFPRITKDIVEQIENYFTPDTYILKITKGQQELRLIGEEVLIHGDKYKKMFNVLNSTDKSRALQMSVGLIRLTNKSGFISTNDDYTGFVNKHYTSSLPGKVEGFLDNLKDFEIVVQYQIDTLTELMNKTVSFKELVEHIVTDKKGLVSANQLLKLKAFSSIIRYKIDYKSLSSEEYALLRSPQFFNKEEFVNVDFRLNAYQVMVSWIEVFKNYDSSVIRRETNRVLEIIK